EAVDYILKPFSHIEIIKAVSKVVRLFKDRDINNILQLAQISGLNKSGMNNKLKIVSSSGILFLNINDIIHIEADGSYSIVYLTNNKKYTACKSLKEFEENLSHRGFYRIHTYHLINVDYISQLNTTEGNVVCLENGSTIPVSRRNKQEFIKFLERV
ncbi:MAG TPA: LytTR family DNA-binding domain-containing protein, partial [Saprospiraceae bacterium]|nr:LytTR family DNA-binding domain-containing protein [Saprospiraceae bacterium]